MGQQLVPRRISLTALSSRSNWSACANAFFTHAGSAADGVAAGAFEAISPD